MSSKTDKIIFTFQDAIVFEKRCMELTRVFINRIHKKNSIILPAKIASQRNKKALYIEHSLEFYIKRANFIINCTEDRQEDVELLKSILRGMLETCCRLVYMNSEEVEESRKIMAIIWLELCHVAALSTDPPDESINLDYKILKDLGENDFPDFESIRNLVNKEVQSLGAKRSELIKLAKKYAIPKTESLIKDHITIDEFNITNQQYYVYYALLSEQVHANQFWGLWATKREKYQVLGLLIVLHLKLLKETAIFLENDLSQKEYSELFEEYKNDFGPFFADLWALIPV